MIYAFFGIGALWSSTGVLQDIMKSMTPFVFAGVVLLTVWWTYEFSYKLFWALCIVAVTWAVEALGMATSLPVSVFAYTDALDLRMLEVPVAKPVLWLLIIAASDVLSSDIFSDVSAACSRRYLRWCWISSSRSPPRGRRECARSLVREHPLPTSAQLRVVVRDLARGNAAAAR